MSRNHLTRSNMFYLFECEGIPTPLHDEVFWLKDELNPSDLIVVYINEYEHQGEGKVLCTLEEALKKYSSCYASKYINTNKSISWRELRVGDYYFLLRYESNDSWRSNVGEVNITIEKWCISSENRKFNDPLYAIDYVSDGEKLLAVDFNTSPMVRGTGIEDIVPAKDLAVSIKKYIK